MERYVQLKRAAEMCGVQPRTLRGWLVAKGFEMPAAPQRGRRVILIPERMLERVMEERTPRLVRA